MKFIAKTHGGILRDCVFDCSILVSPSEAQDLIDQIQKTGRIEFQCKISELLEGYE